MRLNHIAPVIKAEMEKYAQTCTITTKEGKVITIKVVADHLWKRDKSRFEGNQTKIGIASKDYIIGLFTEDVSSFGEKDILTLLGVDYYFIKSSPVCIGDEVLYYTSVLRRIIKEDDNVFE